MMIPLYNLGMGLHFDRILEPRDALTLLVVCRRIHEVGKQNQNVPAFAITRPLVSESAGLTLSSWSNVWRACSSSAEDEGWCTGVWARALEFNVVVKNVCGNDRMDKHDSLRLASSFIQTIWRAGEDQGCIHDLDPGPLNLELQQDTVSCILAVYGECECGSEGGKISMVEMMRITGLVALSSTRFALILSEYFLADNDDPDEDVGTIIFVSSDIHALLAFTREQFAFDRVWVVARLDSERCAREYCRGVPAHPIGCCHVKDGKIESNRLYMCMLDADEMIEQDAFRVVVPAKSLDLAAQRIGAYFPDSRRRRARDGMIYTYGEFHEWYGVWAYHYWLQAEEDETNKLACVLGAELHGCGSLNHKQMVKSWY